MSFFPYYGIDVNESKSTSELPVLKDIAIDFKGKNNPLKIAEIREILEESTIPYSVDVVDMHNASEGILQEIKKEGIRWK